jgi:hypothetical protein
VSLICSLSFCLNFDSSPFQIVCTFRSLFVFGKQTCLSLLCLSECELFSYICALSAFLYPSFDPFSASKALISKLSSFCAMVLLLFYNFIFILLTHFQPPLLISSDDHIHHKLIGTFLPSAFIISDLKIVTILILDNTCLSYTSQSQPTRDKAFDQAYSRYCASNIHVDLTKQFCASPKEYSILQFVEFILKHRL